MDVHLTVSLSNISHQASLKHRDLTLQRRIGNTQTIQFALVLFFLPLENKPSCGTVNEGSNSETREELEVS